MQVMKLPTGTSINIRALTGPNGPIYAWSVTNFGKEKASGYEEDKNLANKAALAALGEWAKTTSNKSAGKANARFAIRYMLERRTYLVAAVTELLLAPGGDSLPHVITEAREGEKAWRKKDPVEYRKPIPTHHLSMTPEKGAEKLVKAFIDLGMLERQGASLVLVGNRLKTWATKTLSEDFKEM
jgi:hypothetical protein